MRKLIVLLTLLVTTAAWAAGSRNFESTSTQSLTVAATARAAYPLTVTGWWNLETDDGAMWSEGRSGSNNGNVTVRILGGDVRWVVEEDGGTSVTVVDISMNAGTGSWHHACVGSAATNDHWSVGDGRFIATDTTTLTYPTVDQMGIGVLNRQTPALYFDGEIAEVMVFDRSLARYECAELASGILEETIALRQPGTDIDGDWTLNGTASPEPDASSNNNDMTVNSATEGTLGPPPMYTRGQA